MNTRIIYIGLIILVAFSSCKKWLDVQPEDRFTGEQIFKTKDGFATAINGVYLDMSTQKLYGANLNSTILEVFAQRYNFDSQVADLYSYSIHDYNNANVKATIDQIWTSMYVNITNVNKFIEHLDADKGAVLSASEDSLFKGEAIGLRAFMHLDLLRMYGPIYNSADSTKPAIPYSTVAGTSYGPILPANQVMGKILSDLHSAESLLANDPIRNGVQSGQNQTYLNNRNQRMNYFAVKGLQARALLYRGIKQQHFWQQRR
ncbi:RagB/SusD family nutrient uptake outer membrane protein [Pedobacter riviphilus]|uniref:RagB/SusD family nutrient uptake outer membrane protein n=1 Tax=Pedobacter riviphilus TaxID=2766984 RepID=A0ABX6TGY8_9SPHI|nr:RagB/SusD family nutrient uptake outer membrane protein [Pedobacter riviphilus]QNR84757.1 RagB/SusD family nutrient uptake outer membrane protein [Pedobacter riviphilus]